MSAFSGLTVAPFVRVDFHQVRTDRGLNALERNASFPVIPGATVVAVEEHSGYCPGVVREIHTDGKMVIDPDWNSWVEE